MKGIDRINERKIIGSPPTAHRTSLVENIQIEKEIVDDDEETPHSSFFSLTLHSLGIILGDM